MKIETRKIFLEEIPKKGRLIDWKRSVGSVIYFIYDDIQGYIKIINYERDKKGYLTILYNNKKFKISTDILKYCNIGSIIGTKTSDFKIEIGTRFQDNKRDIIVTDRKKVGARKYYKYKCNKCSFDCGEHYKNGEYKKDYWIQESHLLNNKSGCAVCCESSKIVVKGYNDIPTTAPWLISYFQEGYDKAKKYAKSSNKKIYPICPDCGMVANKKYIINSIYSTHSIACSCSDSISFPNKMMFNILTQLQLNFISEYSPKWINQKRYDFYFKLNSKKYIIEMDGELGHGKRIYNKNNISKEESKAIDEYKDEKAKRNGIEVIRIDCVYKNNDAFEYIKSNILNNNKLNKLFNMNNIDWNQCNEYALSNLVKTTCEYKRNNPDITTGELINLMGYVRSTITRWLKQGTKLGWCSYNGKEEQRKNGKRGNGGKRIEILKENISLGEFPSAHELERQSEELFGVKLNFSCICAVCRGKKLQYKGFTFKFIK